MTFARRRPRVLCVDDDPVMLDIITRMINADYEVLAASNADQALRLIENSAPLDVVISDLRMEGISGAQLLQSLRKTQPMTVRILLTGETDLAEAVGAMNQAGLFRLVPKPASRAVLLDTLAAAVTQRQLQVAEHELLQETVMGTMRVLADVLAAAAPTAYGRSARIQELALAVSKQMNLLEQWPLEFASLACQLGHIALPEETLRHLQAGASLTAEENIQVGESAKSAQRMLARIPRLGPVIEILTQLASDGQPQTRNSQTLAAQILKAVTRYEVFERLSTSRSTALQRLRAQAHGLDREVVTALVDVVEQARTADGTPEVAELQSPFASLVDLHAKNQSCLKMHLP